MKVFYIHVVAILAAATAAAQVETTGTVGPDDLVPAVELTIGHASGSVAIRSLGPDYSGGFLVVAVNGSPYSRWAYSARIAGPGAGETVVVPLASLERRLREASDTDPRGYVDLPPVAMPAGERVTDLFVGWYGGAWVTKRVNWE